MVCGLLPLAVVHAVAAQVEVAPRDDAPLRCSTVFEGCAAQLHSSDDAGCFVRQQDDATNFPRCTQALRSHFAEFESKTHNVDAMNELVLGGATGTCFTALRHLHSDALCPMPLPPLLADISVSADAFNVFTLGDWGPTPPGEVFWPGHCATGNRRIECKTVPASECRQSLFNGGHTPSMCDADKKNNEAQQLVANAMAKHAEEALPVAVVSVGDHFYMGGIPTPANLKRHDALGVDLDYAFTTTWHDVYLANSNGNKLNVPWLAVLGNHDYGGAGCQADWQVQIDYTKKDPTKKWRMPYTYYKQRIQAKSYDVDIFMLEVNEEDIYASGPEHSICTQKHCGNGKLRGDYELCKQRMLSKIDTMYDWLEAELQSSVQQGVRWRILAGHFPFGTDSRKITGSIAKKYGAALYVAGHTHAQQFRKGTNKSVPILVSGAGGGYTKEGDGEFYGFGNLAIAKDKITVTLLNDEAKVTSTHELPYEAPPPLPTASLSPALV